MKTNSIFISDNSIANGFIKSYEYPYQVLPNIKEFILRFGLQLDQNYLKIEDDIWIHKTAKIGKNVEIVGPCIIDENAELRHNAYIRGSVIIGKNCVLGNSCEIKNSIMYDCSKVPHFNYVGDSILGYNSYMGASAVISNLKSDHSDIKIKYNDEVIDTHMKKIGAFLGDNVEIGCGCILNPGTIVLSNTNIYPLVSVRGVIPSNSILKTMNNIVVKK